MPYICMLKHQIILNVNTVFWHINCLVRISPVYTGLHFKFILFISLIWSGIRHSVKLCSVYYVSFTCFEIPCFWWRHFFVLYVWVLLLVCKLCGNIIIITFCVIFCYIAFYFTPNSSKNLCFVSWVWSSYCFVCWQMFCPPCV
jgi:hypothetical protein